MSEEQEQNSGVDSANAQISAAFARLGVELDDENGSDADTTIAALNGIADRMEAGTAERNALAGDLAAITALLEAAGYAVVDSHTVVGRVEEVLVLLVALADERDGLKRQLASQKGQTTQARNAVAALEARVPPEPRVFADIKTPLSPTQLVTLLDDAEQVELVFLGQDGVEVSGLAPRDLTGGAFQVAANGLRLRVPSLRVHGPSPGYKAYELAGYALLIDGDLAALAKRGEVLRLAPGTTFELKGDVSFG